MTTDFANQLAHQITGLRRYARALTRNGPEADDLVQDTLERALAKQALYDGSAPLSRWVSTIMRHIFVNRLREARRYRRLLSQTPEALDPSSAAITPPDQFHRCRLREVGGLLADLPLEGARVVSLVALQGHRYADAARFLGIPIGTIRSRLSRSRAALEAAGG
jgi:RNA polymerase sigma-70 factor (ECF subfamily)